ncbi:hypothetical protein RPIT_03660 [Tessaracoccus flavus]|uniref:Uncharacterized protein n=1 Tax=Tessaracoccus flavus TaxID=1610493 RepID=A0A1Q2CD63_9ACTN|nr:hypothetical protein RPIT_03660 [Tessaracoccus flavus]
MTAHRDFLVSQTLVESSRGEKAPSGAKWLTAMSPAGRLETPRDDVDLRTQLRLPYRSQCSRRLTAGAEEATHSKRTGRSADRARNVTYVPSSLRRLASGLGMRT